MAFAHGVLPAHGLLLDGGAGGFGADVFFGVARAVCLSEGMTSCNQGYGLFVVHRHALKGFSDVLGCCQGVRVAIGAFGIDVDEAHLDGGQGIF